LLQLAVDGWIWQQVPAKKMRNNEPYKADGLKFFFSSGVEVDVNYIGCLLLADHLFQKGYACLPHGLSNKQYSQVLSGSLSPKDLLQLASTPARTRTSKQASSKSAAALQDDADVYAGYACNVDKAIHDKVTSLMPLVARKSGGSAPVHSKPLPRASSGKSGGSAPVHSKPLPAYPFCTCKARFWPKRSQRHLRC
jgi:hypothetical protein